MRALVLLTATLALTAGCVQKSKYVALQAEYDATRTSLEGKLADHAATILRLEGEVEALNGKIRSQQEEIARKEQALAELQEKNARMLADQSGLQGEITAMRAALADLERRKAKAEEALNAFRDLVRRFKSLSDAGTVQVKIVNGRMVVALATDILFPSGSATLSKEGKAAIGEVAAILATIPDREFQVEGHTDNVPIASEKFPSNWYLAAARAINVVETMVAAGMPPEKVSAASYADFRPIDTNKTKEGKAANRRIEIVVVPDLSQLPGYEELQGAK